MLPSSSSKRLSKGFSKIERAEKIGDMYRQLRVIPAPGLSDIKQMEMYKKIRPIAPSQFHYFYPEPCREVLDRFKANSKLKRKKRTNPLLVLCSVNAVIKFICLLNYSMISLKIAETFNQWKSN